LAFLVAILHLSLTQCLDGYRILESPFRIGSASHVFGCVLCNLRGGSSLESVHEDNNALLPTPPLLDEPDVSETDILSTYNSTEPISTLPPTSPSVLLEPLTSAEPDTASTKDPIIPSPPLKQKALHHLSIPTGYYHPTFNGTFIQTYCDVYILGTAHVSRQSCTEAQSLMQEIQPDFLFLELCTQRLALLEEGEEGYTIENTTSTNTNNEKAHLSHITSDLLAKNPGMTRVAAMSSALLTKIQADYASKLGVVIGGEFRIAFQMAVQQQGRFEQQFIPLDRNMNSKLDTSHQQEPTQRTPNGCTVILGDRPMRLTLIRAWESLNLFSKIRLVLGLLWSCLRQPSEEELRTWIESILNDPNSDILTKSMEELGRTFPTIQRTIVHERDEYMAAKLLQLAKLMGEATAMDGKKRVVVAIVGVGHCKGMVSFLQKYAEKRRNDSLAGVTMIDDIAPLEQLLQTLVETKRHRADKEPEIQALISDITVVDSSQSLKR